MSAKFRCKFLHLHWKTEFDDEIYPFSHSDSSAACSGGGVVGR